MRQARSTAALAAFAVWLGGCAQSTTPTEVIVFINAESGVRDATHTLRVQVDPNNAGASAFEKTVAPKWPLKLALAPKDGDASRLYTVTAEALDADRDVLASARLTSGYVRGQKRFVVLLLEDACLGKDCGPVRTCHAGECASASVEPEQLGSSRPSGPELEMHGDSGSGGTAGRGSGGSDAGTTSAGDGGAGGTGGTAGTGGTSMGGSGGTGGSGVGVCTPMATRCSGNGVQTCDAAGQWGTRVECVDQGCDNGACAGVCAPTATSCDGPLYRVCDATWQWSAGEVTVGQCDVVCEPQTTQCSEGGLQTCGEDGQWGASVACDASTPYCVAGACSASPTPPSCEGLADDCGPSSNESCCTSPLVMGGMYNRSNDPSYPATLSAFRLDKYEITVGRFRNFVAAWVGGWRPAAGSGKHAHLNGGSGLAATGGGFEPGWDPASDSRLPTTSDFWNAELLCPGVAMANGPYPTWTNTPGQNEALPINCATWYETYAFCIWDGGFLPSVAEWSYAAVGGDDQRAYPWGDTTPGADANLMVYGCYYSGAGTCTGLENIAPVGWVPAGNGRYGQADLFGNMFEEVLDCYAGYSNPCSDCTDVLDIGSVLTVRRILGGLYGTPAADLLGGGMSSPRARTGSLGGRCARSP